ncbi:MAG: hypothetical protein ACPG5P_03635, partial [Saprospiraceae bacterium]
METYLGASYANNINQMATAALLDVLEGPAKTAFVEKLLGTVPPTFKDKINASATVFKGFLHEFIYSRSTKKFDFITTLYLVSSEYPNVRQAFAEIMKAVPFKPPYFKFVRAIFKIAEYRNDGQIFGTLAYRFEKQNPFFNRPSHSGGVWAAGGWVADVEKELKKANTKLAYSQRTQSYMNRRIWRWMNKLTAEQDENFVKIATGLLLSYSQEDYTRPQKDVRWKYNKQTRRYDKSTVHFDAFADSQLLNYILYANSSRYEYMKDRKKWKCINGFMPGMEAPKEREEACPKLWDKVPRAFVHLLVESEVDKVQEFALRAFQNHAEYKPLTTKIDANLIARFLEKSFRPTAIWGLDLAKKKYDPNNPNRKLTLSMVGSSLEEARTLGKQWIQNNYDFFFSNTDFILTMLMHKQEDIRKWIKEDLSKIISKLTTPQKQVLAGRIISHLLAYKAKKENNPIAREYADILTAYFPDLMKRIGLSVIRDLMKHKLEENQKFAGELILGHETRAEDLPVDLFEAFIRSQRPHHRAIGIELFGRFPDATLLGRQEELLKFATSALADVRGAVRPVILRLAKEHESFGLDCVNRFVPILLRKEKYEGLHTDMYGLLTSELNT